MCVCVCVCVWGVIIYLVEVECVVPVLESLPGVSASFAPYVHWNMFISSLRIVYKCLQGTNTDTALTLDTSIHLWWCANNHVFDDSSSKANVTSSCWCSIWLTTETEGKERNSSHKDYVTLDKKLCEKGYDCPLKQSVGAHSKTDWLCDQRINVHGPTLGRHAPSITNVFCFFCFFLPWCGFFFEPVNLSQGLSQLILQLLFLLVQLLSRFSLC